MRRAFNDIHGGPLFSLRNISSGMYQPDKSLFEIKQLGHTLVIDHESLFSKPKRVLTICHFGPFEIKLKLGTALKLSPSKSVIGAKQVSFLGHSISPAGVRPGTRTIQALDHTPMPTDVYHLRSLLGERLNTGSHCPTWPSVYVTSLVCLRSMFRYAFYREYNPIGMRKICEPRVLTQPQWVAVVVSSRPIGLYRNAD